VQKGILLGSIQGKGKLTSGLGSKGKELIYPLLSDLKRIKKRGKKNKKLIESKEEF